MKTKLRISKSKYGADLYHALVVKTGKTGVITASLVSKRVQKLVAELGTASMLGRPEWVC